MFLSLLRGAVGVSKCQTTNKKKKSKTMHAWQLTDHEADKDKWDTKMFL